MSPLGRGHFWTHELGDQLDSITISGPLDRACADEAIAMVTERGFAILESEPADLSPDAIALRSSELFEFGSALGTPVVQSMRNEMVEDIKDYSDIEDDDDRGYRSAGELLPHSDPPTLIVLHCVTAARTGGESSLVSVASIVDRMRSSKPSLVDALHTEMPQWRVAGQYGSPAAGPNDEGQPVLTDLAGRTSCVLYRPFIEMAADALSQPLSPEQTAALDVFEQYSANPGLTLRFTLRPGQTLVLHNRSVLHARTDFSDWPEIARRRHLLRMWIDSPNRFPVDPRHELGDFFAPL